MTDRPISTVEDALRARARGDAAATVAAAEEWRRATLDAARRQAEEVVAAARAQGEADAEDALRGERARIRREARAEVLRAEREAYDALRAGSVERVGSLLGELGDVVRDRVRREAATRLGPGARLQEQDVGPVALDRGRRLRVDADELVDRVLAALGSDVTGLWSP